MKVKLIVLWRHEGEEIKNYRSIKEAKQARNQLDMDHGNKIIKMEIFDAE
jgi:hypothetical protein